MCLLTRLLEKVADISLAAYGRKVCAPFRLVQSLSFAHSYPQQEIELAENEVRYEPVVFSCLCAHFIMASSDARSHQPPSQIWQGAASQGCPHCWLSSHVGFPLLRVLQIIFV
jgi:hypothetical protein